MDKFDTSLFTVLDKKLIDLLKSLSPDDWDTQSLAPQWNVKDIAAHLLDGNLRAVSILRDGHIIKADVDFGDYRETVGFLNGLNADWVTAMKRISPSLLIELLESSGKAYCKLMADLDQSKIAMFSVAWAGQEVSTNAFHIAREYTEKWHHQQQIRYAVHKTKELMTPELFTPYIETSMQALVHHYRNVEATSGTTIELVIHGETKMRWYISKNQRKWILSRTAENEITTSLKVKDDIVWRIFTKGVSSQDAIYHSEIIGDQSLGLPFFDMLAVMA